MKRKIFALALAGLVAFSFTSCGDDDDDPPAPNNNNGQNGSQNGGQNNGDNNGGNNGGTNNGGNGGEQQGNGKNHYVVVDVPAMEANPWDSQFWIVLPEGVAEGDDITISMKVKADVETPKDGDKEVFGLQWHDNPSEYTGNMASGMSFTTSWETIERTETVGAIPEGKVYKSITWNLNNFAEANKYYFDDISVKVNGVEKITNGNMEGTDFKCFYKKELNTDTDPVVVPETSVKEE